MKAKRSVSGTARPSGAFLAYARCCVLNVAMFMLFAGYLSYCHLIAQAVAVVGIVVPQLPAQMHRAFRILGGAAPHVQAS